MKHAVIYEKGPACRGAYFPGLPGVISAGESREEGLTVPGPSSFAGEVDIPR